MRVNLLRKSEVKVQHKKPQALLQDNAPIVPVEHTSLETAEARRARIAAAAEAAADPDDDLDGFAHYYGLDSEFA